MKTAFATLLAGIALAESTVPLNAAPAQRRAAAPAAPSSQKVVADAKLLGEWVSRLLAAQDKAISVLHPIDEAYIQLEQAAKQNDQAAIDAAHDKIDAAIAQAKAKLAEAKTDFDALPSLKGNSVLRELPPGHEGRLRQFTLDTIQQFSNIVDRSETMTLAIATGQSELAREFGDLMLDARGEVLSGQIRKIEIMDAATKSGINQAKLRTMGAATEAMLILFKGQVNILRNKPANFDIARLSAIGPEIAEINRKGRIALKAERAKFDRERHLVIPSLVAPNLRIFNLTDQWFTYGESLPALFSELPKDIEAAGNDLDALDKVYNKVLTVEDSYAEHTQKLNDILKNI